MKMKSKFQISDEDNECANNKKKMVACFELQ